MRYRAVFDTMPSGAYMEFSNETDAGALARVRRLSAIYGQVVALSEQTGVWSARTIDIEEASR